MDNKRKRDGRVSKDRKLKYIIHDKIINFMAPMDTEILAQGREDVLKILFGCSTKQTQDQEEKPSKVTFADEAQANKRQKVEEDEDEGIELI